MSRVWAFRIRLAALFAVSLAAGLSFVGSASAQKVDGVPDRESTAPVNLQLIPTDAFVRIRGWSLPAPILPLAILGSWGGRGTVSGAGQVNVPVGQISAPSQFEFPRDINGEEETMVVSLSARGDWNGTVDPLSGSAGMHMPMTLRIQASRVRMVDLPWPGGWIYGNIDCTVPLDFGPMTTGTMDPPDPAADPAPVLSGTRYNPGNGQFTVINNAMTIGGFNCTRPDIGSGQVEDELNAAVAIPAPAGRTDARFNLTFLEGGNIIRPKPAIRPAFTSVPGRPLEMALNAGSTYARAGAHRYLWDLDADGKADEVSASPHLARTFPAARARKVGLRVIDRHGDISSWLLRDVKISERAGAGVPKLAPLRLLPKRRSARRGKRTGFKVVVRNVGLAPLPGARVCLKAPKRVVATKRRCR
ncbi:MAG: hypothetical protein M3Y23_04320, partial [Actinomycetota bacterium]|nr:hypothetical protein [Actinomycetota bacterium]